MPLSDKLRILGLLAISVVSAPGEAQPSHHTTYYRYTPCGIEPEDGQEPPAAHVVVMTERGLEWYMATWRGVSRRHGYNDERITRWDEEEAMYVPRLTDRYVCTDFIMHDLDSDGDLDVLYATPFELTIFVNEEDLHLADQAVLVRFGRYDDVRIHISDVDNDGQEDIVVQTRAHSEVVNSYVTLQRQEGQN